MSTLWVDKFVVEIKDLILKRNSLVKARESLKESVANGRNFFVAESKNPDAAKLASGARRMLEIIDELSDIDKQIFDLDTIIVSNLEMYLGDFTARVNIPDGINQAGDVVKGQVAYVVPFKKEDSELVEISPDDIWFLKMIKEAMKANNIMFEKKVDSILKNK